MEPRGVAPVVRRQTAGDGIVVDVGARVAVAVKYAEPPGGLEGGAVRREDARRRQQDHAASLFRGGHQVFAGLASDVHGRRGEGCAIRQGQRPKRREQGHGVRACIHRRLLRCRRPEIRVYPQRPVIGEAHFSRLEVGLEGEALRFGHLGQDKLHRAERLDGAVGDGLDFQNARVQNLVIADEGACDAARSRSLPRVIGERDRRTGRLAAGIGLPEAVLQQHHGRVEPPYLFGRDGDGPAMHIQQTVRAAVPRLQQPPGIAGDVRVFAQGLDVDLVAEEIELLGSLRPGRRFIEKTRTGDAVAAIGKPERFDRVSKEFNLVKEGEVNEIALFVGDYGFAGRAGGEFVRVVEGRRQDV